MIRKRLIKKIAQIPIGVLLMIPLAASSILPAQAQSVNTRPGPSDSWLVSEAFSPPNRGAPPATAEGGTRGCGNYEEGAKALTPLIPEKFLALTVSEHPTFFWYVPGASEQTLEFTLLDKNDEEVIYQTTFAAPVKSGIVSLQLPSENVEALKTGEMYHWYLVTICDPNDRSGDLFVDGWIERTEATMELTAALEDAQADEIPSIYARNGIWHEALASLAQLRQENPEDSNLAERWQQLLNSVDLGEFSEEPLVARNQSTQE